jgi:hypothetical protein
LAFVEMGGFRIVNIPPVLFSRLSTALGVITPAIFVMALYWAARILYAPFFALLVMAPLLLEVDFAGCLRLVNIY